ncbi:MAG: hypothetical protein KGQ89_01645 [Verrucomicrobia bacterium]|nr:hypothetical protein [Verrucomicrobiota bacterium]
MNDRNKIKDTLLILGFQADASTPWLRMQVRKYKSGNSDADQQGCRVR